MKIDEMIEKLQQMRNECGNIDVIVRCGCTISSNLEIEDINNESYGYNRISIVDKDRD